MNLSYVLRRASEAMRNRAAMRERERRFEDRMAARAILAPMFVTAAQHSEALGERQAEDATRAWTLGKNDAARVHWRAAAEHYETAVSQWMEAGGLGWIENAEEQARLCRTMQGLTPCDAVRVEIRS